MNSTPDPVKVGTDNVSEVDKLLATNPSSGDPVDENQLAPAVDIQATPEEVAYYSAYTDGNDDIQAELYGMTDESKYSPGQAQAVRDYEYNHDVILGSKFTFENIAQAFEGEDNLAIQGANQTWGQKFRRGTARFLGETLLDVAEIPGVVGGALSYAVTGDITDMTSNWYVNLVDNGQQWLTENNEIYKRAGYDKQGVIATMLDMDWWATEGASGAAFFASALIPGMAMGKVAKSAQWLTKLSRASKTGEKVVNLLGNIAGKTGLATEGIGETALLGQAIEGTQVLGSTFVNTVFEAGMEAKGALESYKVGLLGRLNRGEISEEQYSLLLQQAPEAAEKVFWANNLLLLGPNIAMSKVLFGKGSTSWSKLISKTSVDDVGNIVAKTARKGWGGVVDRGVKAGKVFGENWLREGAFEEVGQSTIEEYNTKGFINEQLGGRKENALDMYGRILASKEGQIAALYGGVLGSAAAGGAHIKNRKTQQKQVNQLIEHLNSGLNYYTASRADLYKYETMENGMEAPVIDSDGNFVIDNDKVAAVADAYDKYKEQKRSAKEARRQGKPEMAAIIESNMQAEAFVPFLGKGQEGLDALREALTNSLATKDAVEWYNANENADMSVDQYIDLQMDIAKQLNDDVSYHNRSISSALINKNYRDLGVNSAEEKAKVDKIRTDFNDIHLNKYVATKSALHATEREIADLKAKDKELTSKSNTKFKSKIEELTKIKDKLTETLTDLESEEQFEKDWKAYYKNKQLIAKYNSGEITGYLDNLIEKIQDVNTTKEVDDIIKQAHIEGVLLPGVSKSKIPEELLKMSESDKLSDVLGALRIFQAHSAEDVEYEGLANNAVKQIEALVSNITDTLGKVAGEQIKLSDKLSEQIDLNIAAVTRYKDIAEQVANIDEILRESRVGRGNTEAGKKNRQTYNELVKQRRALTKELAKVTTEIANTQKNVMAIKSRLVHVAEMDKFIKAMSSATYTENGDLIIDVKDAFMYNDIIETTKDKRDLLIEEQPNLVEFLDEYVNLKELEYRIVMLKAHKAHLESLLHSVDKAIKKYRKMKQTPETAELIIELEREYDVVIAKAEGIGMQLDLANDEYELATKGIEQDLLATFQSYNGLLNLLSDLSEGKDVRIHDTRKPIDNIDSITINELNKVVTTAKNNNNNIDKLYLQEVIRSFEIDSNNPEISDYITYLVAYTRGFMNDIELMSYDEFTNRESEYPASMFMPGEQFTPGESFIPGIPFVFNTETGFIQASDPTKGQGVNRLTSNAEKSAFEAIFAADEAIFNKFIDNLLKHPLDYAGIGKYIKLAMIYHPRLAKDKRFIEKLKGIPAEAYVEEAEALQEKYEGESVKQTSEKEKKSLATSKKEAREAYDDMHDDMRDNKSKTPTKKVKDKVIKTLKDIHARMVNLKGSKVEDSLKRIGETLKASYNSYINEFKKRGKQPDQISAAVDLINGSDALKEHIRKIINDKKAQLAKDEYDRMVELALEDKSLRNVDLSTNGYLSNGATVKFELGDKTVKGNIVQMFRSKESGSVALIEREGGGLSIVATTAVKKDVKTVKEVNSDNYNDHKKVIDKNTGELVLSQDGDFTATRLTTLNYGIRKKLILDKDGKPVLDKDGNQTYEYPGKSNQAFKEYLEDPRDKSKDEILFQFAPSKLIEGTDEEGHPIIRYGDVKEAYWLLDALKVGARSISDLTETDKDGNLTKTAKHYTDLLIDLMPISARVNTGGKHNWVGTYLLTTPVQGKLGYIDRAVREAIIVNWIAQGAKFGKQGVLANVSANWKAQAGGTLNIKNNTRTKLSEMKHVDVNKLELLTVQGMSDGMTIAYDKEGRKVKNKLPGRLGDMKGMTFLMIKNNLGHDFPLALQNITFGELNGGKELAILNNTIYEALNTGKKKSDSISGKLIERMNKETPELVKAFGDTKLTYGNIIDTLLFSSGADNQINVEVLFNRRELKIGNQTWDASEILANADMISKMIGFKNVRVGVRGDGLNMNKPEYLNYLVESGIITSQVPAGEAAFSTVTAEDKRMELGLEVYLAPDSIKSTASGSIGVKEQLDNKTIKEYDTSLTFMEKKMLMSMMGGGKIAKVDLNKLNAAEVKKMKEKLNSVSTTKNNC